MCGRKSQPAGRVPGSAGKKIDYYEEKRNHKKCIEYARKYIQTDKYEENMYRRLMIFYSLVGNRSRVSKTFDRCRKNLLEGLDSPASRETEKLCDQLVSE
ncbi:MAG: hypothetical protein GY866_16645 [Proteobacteria bacterium]|nr:hypothetical protein [Pseudomonadota bacterium]